MPPVSEGLRALLRRTPSVSVRIHLSDGTAYDVKHPEMAFLTRSAVVIGVEKVEGGGIADAVHHCSLVHIGRVENLNWQDTQPGE